MIDDQGVEVRVSYSILTCWTPKREPNPTLRFLVGAQRKGKTKSGGDILKSTHVRDSESQACP